MKRLLKKILAPVVREIVKEMLANSSTSFANPQVVRDILERVLSKEGQHRNYPK